MPNLGWKPPLTLPSGWAGCFTCQGHSDRLWSRKITSHLGLVTCSIAVPIRWSALGQLFSFRLNNRPGHRCISPTTMTRWQTSMGQWKPPNLEKFRGKIQILSTHNLLCRKIATSCPADFFNPQCPCGQHHSCALSLSDKYMMLVVQANHNYTNYSTVYQTFKLNHNCLSYLTYALHPQTKRVTGNLHNIQHNSLRHMQHYLLYLTTV